MNKRLQHDVAFAAATACVDVVARTLHPSEHRNAFDAFYRAFRAALEKYDAMRELEAARLRPSRN
jgi:hypothetical protein